MQHKITLRIAIGLVVLIARIASVSVNKSPYWNKPYQNPEKALARKQAIEARERPFNGGFAKREGS